MKKILFLLSFIFLSGLNVQANPERIDMTKWHYNSAENVFYQLGIKYCDTPIDEKYEKLAVFIPAQYMKCTQNDGETYSCRIDKNAKFKNYTAKTAPIVMPVEDYASNPALTEYKSVWDYTSEGFIYIYAGSRGHGAPSGVTDLKAAIKYVKYNKNIIPGNINKIFAFGMGGAQSILLGAAGDSKLYEPYLKQIGAVKKISDKIFGVMAWCPITNLDTANIAYEWNMGSTRENLDDDTQKLSDKMSEKYAEYVNNMKFRDDKGLLLTLRETNHGIYKGGNYYKYLEKTVNQSLTNFMADTLFPIDMNTYGKEENFAQKIDFSNELIEKDEVIETENLESNSELNSENTETDNQKPKIDEIPHKIFNSAEEYVEYLNSEKKWINYQNYKVEILSLEDFVKSMKPATKPVCAFDGLERQQDENVLFGLEKPSHFDFYTAKLLENTKYSKDFETDFMKVDFAGNNVETRMNMYNPLYYLLPAYKGYKTSKVAKYWRIRTGLSQTDTALTTEVNLVLALKMYLTPKNVDFETVWACKHLQAERRGTSTENFVNWVKKCSNIK